MGSRRAKRRRSNAEEGATQETKFDSPSVFQAFLASIQSSQGKNPSVLRRLYFLLNCLCSNTAYCETNGVDLNHLTLEIGNDRVKVTIEDICGLSDVLFQELSRKFEQFFLDLCYAYSSKELGDDNCISDTWGTVEMVEMVCLLLRCCLVMLNLLQYQQNYLLIKGQVLLGILQKLSSVNFNVKKQKKRMRFEKSISRSCRNDEDDCTTSSTEDFVASLHFLEPSDPRLHFMSAIIEVILDELLVHGQLRSFFKLFDSVSPTCQMLCKSHYGHGDSGLLMEVIATHFAIAFHDKEVLEDFLQKMFSLQAKEYRNSFRALEIGPTAATLLLLNPIILSSPKLVQSHLISLGSEAIGNVLDYENWKPDCILVNCFLSAFESSIILYTKCMKNLQLDSHCTKGKDSVRGEIPGEKFQPSFDSVLSPVTGKKINQLITKLDDFSESCLASMSYKMKSDLVSSAIRYVKECQHVLDKCCQDESLSILSCIIVRASDSFNDMPSISTGGCLQDLCVLASVLKLMSSSLLQAIRCLRYSGDLNHLKSLRDFSSCKEYDFVLSKISSFEEFKVHLPMQQLLGSMFNSNSMRHRLSKTMFLHFSGLLSLSFASGLDFLVKGCLLNLMAVMNLFVFEDGRLDPFCLLLDCSSKSFSSELPLVSIQQTVTNQKSSLVVASKFQAIRTLYLRSTLADHSTGSQNAHSQNVEGRSPLDTMEGTVGISEETEEACNGEVFLNCLLKDKVSDFDDMADFIACEPGKDYSTWLKDREKFRKWKSEKMAVLRWKRKKRTWRVAKGKKI